MTDQHHKAICQKLEDIQRRLGNIEKKVEAVGIQGERIEYARKDIDSLGAKIRNLHTPDLCPNRAALRWVWLPAVTLSVALIAHSYAILKVVL